MAGRTGERKKGRPGQSHRTFSPAWMDQGRYGGRVSGSLRAELRPRFSEFDKHGRVGQVGRVGQDSSYFGVNTFGGFLRETGQDFT